MSILTSVKSAGTRLLGSCDPRSLSASRKGTTSGVFRVEPLLGRGVEETTGVQGVTSPCLQSKVASNTEIIF